MKKTILAMILAGSSCAVFAQEDSAKNVTLMTTSEYNAYSTFTAMPPTDVHSYIMRDYPAATDLHWRMENTDWWHAYYLDNNGMPMNVYYNMRGNTYTVALPVKQTWIPDAVVTKAVQLYGPVLYDISSIKGSDKQDIYAVRILENGMTSTIWMDENGNKVMDIYRVEPVVTETMNTEVVPAGTEVKTETDMNSTDTKTKVKVKNDDGTETKTKTKNGQTKTKTSGTEPL